MQTLGIAKLKGQKNSKTRIRPGEHERLQQKEKMNMKVNQLPYKQKRQKAIYRHLSSTFTDESDFAKQLRQCIL